MSSAVRIKDGAEVGGRRWGSRRRATLPEQIWAAICGRWSREGGRCDALAGLCVAGLGTRVQLASSLLVVGEER
eukprot:2910174-Pyramimonas_sp.AAC.1